MSELKILLNEWADDFELASSKMPTRLESTILMTRAQECREQAARAQGDAEDEKGSLPWFVEVYNHGYQAGHNDTVEGGFTPVHYTDLQTYHEDEVMELLEGLNVEASHAHPPAKVPEPFGTQSAYEVACKSVLIGSNMNISCDLVRELVEALRKASGQGACDE